MSKLAIFSKTWLQALFRSSKFMLMSSSFLLYGGSLQASALASTGPGAAINLKVIIAAFLFLWWLWSWGVKGKGTVAFKDGIPLMSSQVEAFSTVMEMEVEARSLKEAKEQFFERSGAVKITDRGSRRVRLTYINGAKELYSIKYKSGRYFFTELV